MTRRVLITGASVAGNATAWWLGQYGFDVTVVERAPSFRDGGQNIDVRGLGREVLRRMGLEQAALDHGTGEEGTAWVDANGKAVARIALADSPTGGPTAEMEILRGDLARLLFEAARHNATFRFGDTISAVADDGDQAVVTFASGKTEAYDAVIVAEGVGSATRDLVFPGENDPRWMDMTIGYFTIPRTDHDDRMWRWYHAPGGRSVSLRPDMHGTARAMLMIQKPPRSEGAWPPARQKAFLRRQFVDVGWETPRVLAGMDAADDFYFDVLRQVRMKRWSKGLTVLTGDAAWCVTPLGGAGATLAIVGAYVLAGEMARGENVVAGIAAYERFMRPVAEERQGIPKIVPRLMHPHTRLGIGLLHGALSFASKPLVQTIAARIGSRERKGAALPDYGATPV